MRIRNVLILIIGFVIVLCGSKAFAAWSTSQIVPLNFYVSSSGSDSNNGMSPATPWQTLTNVNAGNFPPNAVINLMTNLTACFNLSFSNSPGPLTIQSYGGTQVTVTCGANTHNFGNNYIGHMFDGINITVNNIKFTNPNADAGTYTFSSASVPNYQFGILFQNSANPNPISVTFVNNRVIGYSQEVGFMYPSAQSNWATCGAGFNGVTVEFNIIGGTSTAAKDVGGIGFYGSQSAAGGGFCQSTVTNFANNITISYNTLQFLEGSSTQNNNWPFSSTGIMVGNAQNVTISYNYIHDIGLNMLTCPGPQGTWSGYTNNLTWAHNEIATVGALGSSLTPAEGGCDQHGLNVGGQGLATTVTDNFIHDVNGAGIFLQELSYNTSGPGWSATVADNIIENPRWAGILTQNTNDTTHNIQPALIYNNTIIANSGIGGLIAVGSQSNSTGSVFKNNLLFAPYLASIGSATGFMISTPDATATTFDYNEYFTAISPASPAPFKLGATTYTTLSAWKTACSCDSHSLFSDPGLTTENLFPDVYNVNEVTSCSVGLNGPGACPAMAVYGGSPAYKAGIGSLSSNPPVDYFGNPLLSPPNIGASQAVVPQTNIRLDTSTSGTATTLSLTTAAVNETIFAAAVTAGASSCTISDGSSLTWNLIGTAGSGTNIITAWEAFSPSKLTSDTITFTCSGETSIADGAMAFRGALGVHDTASGLPVTGSPTITQAASSGADGVYVSFGRSSLSTPSVDPGFTAVVDANSFVMEYALFNILQVSGQTLGDTNHGTGDIADIWH